MAHSIDDLYQRGRRASALSPSTRRDLESAWRVFDRWCADRGYTALPAEPEAVAEFLVSEVERVTVPTLQRYMRAIGHRHEIEELAPPTETDRVQNVMAGIRTFGPMIESGPHEVEVKLPKELALMVDSAPDDLVGIRDRALLLVGRAARLSRSQIVSLGIEDVEVSEGHTVVRSVSRGQPFSVMVLRSEEHDVGAAVQAWITAAEVCSDPLFRPVHKSGAVGQGKLSPQAVTVVLRRAAEHAGLDPSAASTDLFQRP